MYYFTSKSFKLLMKINFFSLPWAGYTKMQNIAKSIYNFLCNAKYFSRVPLSSWYPGLPLERLNI